MMPVTVGPLKEGVDALDVGVNIIT